MHGRPLVVMAGWLGSQPRHLLRYQELYRNLGFEVLSVIAEPWLAAQGTFPVQQPFRVPGQWPRQIPEQPSSLPELSYKVLGEIHNSQPSVVLFHTFSNGGCFVWEHMRRAMNTPDGIEETTRDAMKDIVDKTRGVVFDSCPVSFGQQGFNPLVQLPKLVSETEAVDMVKAVGPELFSPEEDDQTRDRRVKRDADYIDYLCDDPLDVPQLYLFCDDDPITDVNTVRKVIRHREELQNSPVLQCSWEKSVHCCHLLEHPVDYKAAVEQFVEVSMN